jgi:hypothetical protein
MHHLTRAGHIILRFAVFSAKLKQRSTTVSYPNRPPDRGLLAATPKAHGLAHWVDEQDCCWQQARDHRNWRPPRMCEGIPGGPNGNQQQEKTDTQHCSGDATSGLDCSSRGDQTGITELREDAVCGRKPPGDKKHKRKIGDLNGTPRSLRLPRQYVD